jgi:hypothetical protein
MVLSLSAEAYRKVHNVHEKKALRVAGFEPQKVPFTGGF